MNNIFKPSDVKKSKVKSSTQSVRPLQFSASVPFLIKRKRKPRKTNTNAVDRVQKVHNKIKQNVAKKPMMRALKVQEVSNMLKKALKNGVISKKNYDQWLATQSVV